MSTIALLAAGLILGLSVFAFAPAADAKPFCLTPAEGDCSGYVCTTYNRDTHRWENCLIECLFCPGPVL